MKTAVISGVLGQDGAYLASLLLQKQYKVIGLLPHDRFSDQFRLTYLGIESKVELRRLDLLDIEQVKELLEDVRPDEFYNLAAISSVGLSFKQPAVSYDFNTRSVLNMLEGIRLINPQTRFYHASSSEMFGNVGVQSLPIKESLLFHPASPYGISKASAHWLTVNYREAFKLSTCCGILFNHESALRPANFVIKKIINTALKIKNGEENKLVLGNQDVIRDWGYAPYYVEAMWRMVQLDNLSDFIICSGIPISLREVVSKVFALLDLDAARYVQTDQSLLRPSDLQIIYGDNSNAKKRLPWEYSLTPDQLLMRLIEDEKHFMAWSISKATK